MPPTWASLLVFGVSASLVACDTSSRFEGCVSAEDPGFSPGPNPSNCSHSAFVTETFRTREVVGYVRRGADGAPGANVRVEAWAGAFDPASSREDAITSAVGFYGGLRNAALRYDLSVRLPGDVRDDVLVYRGVAARYVEPALEIPGNVLPRSFLGRVDLRIETPVVGGHTLAFFASGDGVYGVTGDAASGLQVHTRDRVLPATLHVVELDPAKAAGLAGAVAYGKVATQSDPNVPHVAFVALAPLTGTVEPSFVVYAPPGFVADPIAVRATFSPTSYALVGSVVLGTKSTFPAIPDCGLTYQVHATREGEVADSGETGLDASVVTTVTLPSPPVTALATDTVALGEQLVANGLGVLEHVLVPEGDAAGPAIRIITVGLDAALPDVTALGAAPATGTYLWSVRSYPGLRYVEQLSGIDTRRYRPVAISAPRAITLR